MHNLILAVGIMMILCFLRVPIYVSILAATLYLQIFVNNIPLAGTVNSLIESLAKSSLLCIPFFVLAGNFLQSSTLGRRLVDLFVVMLRRIRSGFAIAALLANAFFGAISGSSPAAVATFGNLLFKPLESKYDTKLALGLLTSSGALSTIIPPSITLVIYGAATNTSTAELFMAGLLPGLLIVLIVSIYLIFRCKSIPAKDSSAESSDSTQGLTLGCAFLNSLPVLVLPLIILGGIYGGFFTPTEAAAIAVVYACIAALCLKDITFRNLPKIFMGSCKTSAQIMILISASAAFAQAATIAQIPAAVAELLSSLNRFEFLLILNLILLVVGCFFEPGAAVLILSPILFPTASALGIDPIHLGIVFTVNLAIGMFTPPFGLNLFVVQGVLKKPMGEVSRAVIPYIILYFGATLIITYVDKICLLLPNLLM